MTDDRRTPPPTEEGWYALHDFRSVDWDAWRAAPERERERAIEEGQAFLQEASTVEEGASALYAIAGHKADLLILHLRPTLAAVERLERQFERTALAGFTDQPTSYVSVTEASGYSERAREFFEGDLDEESGLAKYIRSRLYPEVPEMDHVCFYPMDKRRDPEYNWYALPFDERAEHMEAHGEIGRDYGGRVTQMITGSVGLDDHEWGVTLWADDLVDVKDLLYEMRFDPSTSKFAEFGQFYVGRRFPPADLAAYLAGKRVPTAAGGRQTPSTQGSSSETGPNTHARGAKNGPANVPPNRPTGSGSRSGPSGRAGSDAPHGSEPSGPSGLSASGPSSNRARTAHHSGNRPPSNREAASTGEAAADGIRGELADLNVYAGQPHGEDVHALVLYSEADPDDLFEEVEGLRGNFDHYDTHVKTAVYGPAVGEGQTAVVSIWETASAAETAAGFLSDLPGIVRRAGDEDDGWGTMGMFYTVKDDRREDFVEKFETVGGLLGDMDGHVGTALLANVENDADMFIDSRWDSKDDAMGFFRSDAFSDTVDWGRDVLADRPRHVFLA